MTETAQPVYAIQRLTPEVLREIRRKVGGPASCLVTTTTTELQAGFQLGINHVLNILAEDFTTAG